MFRAGSPASSLRALLALALAGTACSSSPASGAQGAGGAAAGAAQSASSSAASTSGGAGATGSGGSAPFGSGLFEADNAWTQDVSSLAKSSASDDIIQWLDAHGGWGSDTGEFRIDFSLTRLVADASTPTRTFEPTEDFYDPDCDHVPFPVPEGGALEGEQGYSCDHDGDCHLLVVHAPSKTLYEMWRANISGGVFYGGCAAVWDLTRTYPDDLRGEGCTSADAGGFPISAMLFSADEVASGTLTHAIRFVLPNERIRHLVYVHPGTHSTFPTSGDGAAPPYGVRFRLRASYPVDALPTEGARVVARGLQQYGMFLADGGQIALTAESDRFTEHTWAELGMDAYALAAIRVTDMEVVGMGDPITWSGDCARNP